MGAISLSTVDERLHEPAAFSRRLSSLFSVGFTVEPVGAGDFKALMQPIAIGRLRLAQLDFSPHKTRRSVGPLSQVREHFLLNQVVSGRVFISQDGREAEIGPGELYLINTARDFTLESESMRTNSIYLDAKFFRSVYPEVDCCAAIALHAESGPVKVVSDLLSSLFTMAPTLSPDIADRFADAIPHLVAIALADRDGKENICPSKMNLFHKERVKAFVRDHLADPRLNCEMVSDALKLSQRYIYDIFADEPLTLMRWVRSERLARCHRELSSAVLSNRSISEIAFSWGFVDLAHFSRAFSATYGRSPRAFRRTALSGLHSLN